VTKLIEDKIGFTVSAVGTAVAMALALPASADTLSVTGSFTQYLDDDDRAYAEECAECNSDTNPIRGNPVTFDSLDGFSGEIKWNRELGKDGGPMGADDFGVGIAFSHSSTDTERLPHAYDGGWGAATPYGTLQSSDELGLNQFEDSMTTFRADIEYGWDKGGNSNVRMFAGLRALYTNYERDVTSLSLSSEYTFEGTESSTYWGIGPRVGLSFDSPMGSSQNFSIVGSAAGGFLIGERSHETDPTGSTDSPEYYSTQDEDDTEFVAFAEGELGFGYLVEKGIQIQTGWQAAYTGDVVSLYGMCRDPDEDEARSTGTPAAVGCDGTVDSSVITHGPFLRFIAEF